MLVLLLFWDCWGVEDYWYIQPTVPAYAASRVIASAWLDKLGEVFQSVLRQRVMIKCWCLWRQLADALYIRNEGLLVLDDDKLLHGSAINGLVVRDPLKIKDIKITLMLIVFSSHAGA